ncbi:c-type cytochrome [Sulfurospirillum sp. 1307]|jgi:mono/diheme cytochrome c family protein
MKILLLIALLFLGCEKKENNKVIKNTKKKTKVQKQLNLEQIKQELKVINTTPYLEDYIENIINNGSNGVLGFKSGAMDAGFADKSDAKNIARYVVTLSGKKSSDDKKAKESALFFTSNCGGCHGHDGKGLNGAFPDLTVQTLKGIKLRKEFILSKLKTSN